LPGLRLLSRPFGLVNQAVRASLDIIAKRLHHLFARFLLLSAYPRIHIISTSLPAWYSCSIFGFFDIVSPVRRAANCNAD
jgi:hypothetical protein